MNKLGKQVLGLKDKVNFRENYLEPSLTAELIRMKYPHSPNDPRQRFLLTEKGMEFK